MDEATTPETQAVKAHIMFMLMHDDQIQVTVNCPDRRTLNMLISTGWQDAVRLFQEREASELAKTPEAS